MTDYKSQSEFGPFYRKKSNTQKLGTAKSQRKSNELWGRTARGGFEPEAQAYEGSLPDSVQGIEFFASAPPTKHNHMNNEVRWAADGTSAAVSLDSTGEFAILRVRIVKTRYMCGGGN